MKRGQVVFENDNGKATFQWLTEKDQPEDLRNMYLITYNKGGELWTNSMDIIKKQLSCKIQNEKQLTLF